jgi:hypothetical protein
LTDLFQLLFYKCLMRDQEFDLRKKNNHGCNIRQLGTYQKSCKPQSHKSMVVMNPAAELYQKLEFLLLLPIADQLPLCTLWRAISWLLMVRMCCLLQTVKF